MRVLDSIFNSTGMYFLYIVLVFGAIVLVVILLKKYVFNKNKTKDEIDEEKAADETLNRYLEDINDPQAQKEFDEFNEKQNKEGK